MSGLCHRCILCRRTTLRPMIKNLCFICRKKLTEFNSSSPCLTCRNNWRTCRCDDAEEKSRYTLIIQSLRNRVYKEEYPQWKSRITLSMQQLPPQPLWPALEGSCAHCKYPTVELWSRTVFGRQYCMPCLRRGAGVEEYRKVGIPVSPELWEIARKNGMLKYRNSEM